MHKFDGLRESAKFWTELDKNEQEFYLNMARIISESANRIKKEVDRKILDRLINQDYWT